MLVIDSAAALLASEGQDLGHSDWLLIEQTRIDEFARATGDHQWIHVDPVRAAQGPFGVCIAHGYLTLALANCFLPELFAVKNMKMGVNVGCDKVRFPAPLKVNSFIRATGVVTRVMLPDPDKPDVVQVVIRLTIQVQGQDKPACIVDTVSRFYF